MNIPYVMKRCTKCGKWKVASTINFRRHKKYKYGIRYYKTTDNCASGLE